MSLKIATHTPCRVPVLKGTKHSSFAKNGDSFNLSSVSLEDPSKGGHDFDLIETLLVFIQISRVFVK